jgi:hypothetical protein
MFFILISALLSSSSLSLSSSIIEPTLSSFAEFKFIYGHLLIILFCELFDVFDVAVTAEVEIEDVLLCRSTTISFDIHLSKIGNGCISRIAIEVIKMKKKEGKINKLERAIEAGNKAQVRTTHIKRGSVSERREKVAEYKSSR